MAFSVSIEIDKLLRDELRKRKECIFDTYPRITFLSLLTHSVII